VVSRRFPSSLDAPGELLGSPAAAAVPPAALAPLQREKPQRSGGGRKDGQQGGQARWKTDGWDMYYMEEDIIAEYHGFFGKGAKDVQCFENGKIGF
jgi:hypothetical protein